MTLEVRRFEPGCRDDFFRVHCAEQGTDWCYCVAWWVETWEGFGDRSDADNRRLREELLERGQYDGYLGYLDGVPVTWCQCGPRDRLEKLVAQYELEPDPEVWAVTCFTVVPGHRGRGLAGELLAGVLADLRARGVTRVQAFPRCGEGLEPGQLWTGPEGLYRKHGFEVLREHPEKPVLERVP